MSRMSKLGLVLAGYAAAILAGIVAAKVYDARVSALPYDTSGGMYAGGQALTSLAAFLVVSLAPTLLALWFMRRNERFWGAVSIAALAFAGAGLLAVLMPIWYRAVPSNLTLVLVELFRLAHLLGVPLWTLAFALFAWLAPSRESRRNMLAAVALELVIGVLALVHWFVPGPPL